MESRDEVFDGCDWYAREFGEERYLRCSFHDVDLTEARARGTVFDRCRFANCRFNASEHTSCAFIGCDIRRCSWFAARLDGCKFAGSTFVECVLRPMSVRGGQ